MTVAAPAATVDGRPAAFGDRLAGVVASTGRLCVGIDPHAALLARWGLPDSADGAREFGLRVVDVLAGRVGIVKPQVAFYERHGSAGYAALEAVLAAARSAGLLVIADAKRGDIGSTADAYGEPWLTSGSPLEADAMTAVAYQGLGSLSGVLDLAARHGKGVFVLAATSNPEARIVQTARRSDGSSVARGIVDEVGDRNTRNTGIGDIGVVVGATVALADYGIDPAALDSIPVLAPGFGHQGAHVLDGPALFGAAAATVLPSVSRSVLGAGAEGLASAVAHAAEEANAWNV